MGIVGMRRETEMGSNEGVAASERKRRLLRAFVFCLIGVAINVVGGQLALALHLPLFLDCIGTVLAAMIGGYVPGIIIGYVTNIINSVSDSSTIYYAVINVLIAVVATFLANRGWFDRPFKLLGAIIIFALIGGCAGTLLTWGLYGVDPSSGLGAFLSMSMVDNGVDPAVAQMLANFAIDVLDKAIIVIISVAVVRILPQRIKDLCDFELWQQTPLSRERLEATGHTRARVASVRTKVALLVAVIMVLVAIVTSSISFIMFNRSMVNDQAKVAGGIAALATEAVDADMVNDYLAGDENIPGYKETEQALADIRDSFDNCQYVYVYQIRQDGCHVVFDPDTADEPGSDMGEIVDFDEDFLPYLNELLAGEPIEPLVSNGYYGWLLTYYSPLYDSSGDCVAYVAADLSMDHIINDSYSFLVRVVALFAAFFIVICVLVLWLAKYNIIIPVNSIALTTNGFAFDSEESREDTVEQMRQLNIHTGDEIENLYLAVAKTAEDTMEYIAEDQEKRATIARMQDNLILVMADLVESRDQFTGDHVRKTAAYTKVIMDQMRREGVYADELTDEFVSNVVRSAPLHDIGKIVVSDTILNKPGRLTDEEFKIMQTHTTAGAQVLEQATGAVSEPTYLDEARNLAAYHHEKWNGTGYPSGLAGEDIPLSARIMAVADVFDALVSKRSYKDGFPIEKALDIIREGAGSHFDPKIAEAFLHAESEVRRVAEANGDDVALIPGQDIIDPHVQPAK